MEGFKCSLFAYTNVLSTTFVMPFYRKFSIYILQDGTMKKDLFI